MWTMIASSIGCIWLAQALARGMWQLGLKKKPRPFLAGVYDIVRIAGKQHTKQELIISKIMGWTFYFVLVCSVVFVGTMPLILFCGPEFYIVPKVIIFLIVTLEKQYVDYKDMTMCYEGYE